MVITYRALQVPKSILFQLGSVRIDNVNGSFGSLLSRFQCNIRQKHSRIHWLKSGIRLSCCMRACVHDGMLPQDDPSIFLTHKALVAGSLCLPTV